MLIGEMRCPPVRSLQRIMLKPNIAYAMKHAACPANLFSFIALAFEFANILKTLGIEIDLWAIVFN